jgi:protein-disulfide isomerase
MRADLKVFIAVGLITLLLCIGGIWLFTRESQTPPGVPVDSSLLVRENSHKIATDSATLTLVEFGDFQCPSCGAVHPMVKQLLKDYDQKLNFVYRHFPLSQHPNAFPAAQAAEAASEQGKFWQMYDKLFENQSAWSDASDPLPLFASYAKEIGLNITEFEKAVKANKYTEVITQDQRDGEAAGVNSTPTFYLENQKLDNLTGIEDFKSRIDSRLQTP